MVDLSDVTFYAMLVVTIGGAITALEAKEIIYGAIGLAFSFFGVAGLFFLLDAAFVAVFQLTVYIGAVAVLILFTVMLVREGRWMHDSPGHVGELAGVLTAAALALSLILSFLASNRLNSQEQSLPRDCRRWASGRAPVRRSAQHRYARIARERTPRRGRIQPLSGND